MRAIGGLAAVVAAVLLLASCVQPGRQADPLAQSTAATQNTELPGEDLSQAVWDRAIDGLSAVGGVHAVWLGVAEWEASGDYVLAAAFPGPSAGVWDWYWADRAGEVHESIHLGAAGEITVPITEFTFERARAFLDDVGRCDAGEVRMWAARPMPSGVWHDYGGCAVENKVARNRGAAPGLYNVVPSPQRVLLDGRPVLDVPDWTTAEALTQLWADGETAMGADRLAMVAISPANGGLSFRGGTGRQCGAHTGHAFIRSLTPSDGRFDTVPGGGGLMANCASSPQGGFLLADVAPEEVAGIIAEAVAEHGLRLDSTTGHLVVGYVEGKLSIQVGQNSGVLHTYPLEVDSPAASTD